MFAFIAHCLDYLRGVRLLTTSHGFTHHPHSLSSLEAGGLWPSSSASTVPTPLPHQPLPAGAAAAHPYNTNAAFRLLSLAYDLRAFNSDDPLTVGLAEEAIAVATLALAPACPQITPIRQPLAECHVAHPFIRVRAKSRDAGIEADEPVCVFDEADYPFGGLVALDSIVSIWLPGASGPYIVGVVTSMQPLRDGHILFHLRGRHGDTTGYAVGPCDAAYAPDVVSQFEEHRRREEFKRTHSEATTLLPLPPRCPHPIHERCERCNDRERPIRPVQRSRSSSIAAMAPPSSPPARPLPPLPVSSHTGQAPVDVDTTVSHPPHP